MTNDELIVALEAADEPSRELMLAAFDVLLPEHIDTTVRARFIIMLNAEAYESAALTLLPDGWFLRTLSEQTEGINRPCAKLGKWLVAVGDTQTYAGYSVLASTPALAICAAALRAKGDG